MKSRIKYYFCKDHDVLINPNNVKLFHEHKDHMMTSLTEIDLAKDGLTEVYCYKCKKLTSTKTDELGEHLTHLDYLGAGDERTPEERKHDILCGTNERRFAKFSQEIEYAIHIMLKNKFKTLSDTREILLHREGVFNDDGEIEIEQEVQRLAGAECSKRLVSEVKGHIMRSTYFSRKELNNDFSKFVVSNGILDLDTLTLSPFDSSFLTTVKIPVEFNPKATCPKFIKHLRDSLGSKEDIIRVVEGMANILTANRMTFEMLYIFHGSGSNGKSLIFKVIRGVIGAENCSSLDIHSIEQDRFALAELDGKLANLGGEISDRELNHTARLKQCTSYESIKAEKKGKDPFDMLPFAKHFYSTNRMLNIKDDSDSVYRRITPIEFKNQFLPGINKIEDYDKEILQEEASGIFNLMIQNHRTLLRNKGFRYRLTIGEVREIMKNEADRLRPFVNNCLILKSKDKFIIKDIMYEKIRDYFKYNSFDFPYLKQGLTPELVRHGLSDKINGKDAIKKIDGKAVRVWNDVTWNLDNDWVKSNIQLESNSVTKDGQETTEINS